MIRMRMPNGLEERIQSGTTLNEVARALITDPVNPVVCADVDGFLHDLRQCLSKDCEVTLLTARTREGARVLCHTAAHVVAQAAKRLFPDAALGRDPKSRDLFQVDLEIGTSLRKGDLAGIQEEVDRIIEEDLPIERYSLSKGEARAWLIRFGEVLKLEILERIEGQTVTIYSHGEFSDLCHGPHLQSTGQLPPIRLTSVEDVTWQNDPNAERLHRLCGTFAKAG
ncbi:hypothetical protein ACFLTM_03300 [Candidatus Bipolaricaulota bacterium]